MIKCEICGHDYDKGVEVVVYGQPHRLHNFACAVRALAPRCAYCQRGIVGRGPAAPGWTLTARTLLCLRPRILTN